MPNKYDFLDKYKKDFVGTRYQPKSLIPLRYADMLVLMAEENYAYLQKHLTNLNIPGAGKRLSFISIFIKQMKSLRVKDHVAFLRKVMQVTEMTKGLLEKSQEYALKEKGQKKTNEIEQIIQAYVNRH